MLFKPSDSEQRLPPSYYSGCWHEVSRGFLWGCSIPGGINPFHLLTPDSGLHPGGFIPHAASLRKACAHCGRFGAAASRRSLGSVSVPMRRANLSVPVPVVALVSRYLTNKLIGHGPLLGRQAETLHLTPVSYDTVVSSGITCSFPQLSPCRGYVTHALLALSPLYRPPKGLSRSTCML